MEQAQQIDSQRARSTPLTLSLPVDPSALAGARRAVGDWLAGAGVTRADIDAVVMAVNEACMNAVEHSGTAPAAGIQVQALIDGGRLRLEVRDAGGWREPSERGDRGHGLTIICALTDAVAIDRHEGGTTVVLEKDLTFGAGDGWPAAAKAEVATERIGRVGVARVSGEVDLANVGPVEAGIDAAAGERRGALVVDLSRVGHLDSAGVHMLYRLGHRRHTTGAATCIVAPDGPVRRVLELTSVESAIPVAETVDAAIARLDG